MDSSPRIYGRTAGFLYLVVIVGGIFAGLAPLLCNMPLGLVFYELSKVEGRHSSLSVVFFSLVGTALEGATLLHHLEPQILRRSGHDLGVDPEQFQAQAYRVLKMQSIGFGIALTSFASCCLTFGDWIVRSARPAGVGSRKLAKPRSRP